MEEATGESTASSSYESEGRHSSSSVSYGSVEKRRRERERDMFLGGGARTAYSLRKRLRRSLDDTNGVMVGVCKQCSQAPSRSYHKSDVFNETDLRLIVEPFSVYSCSR